MADIFEALSQIRKASESQGATATAESPGVAETPDRSRSGNIFDVLGDIRTSKKPPKGRPPDEINPPIPPTTFAREMVKNAPSALAQGAVDLAKNVAKAGKVAVQVAKDTGGDIIDALNTIRQPGATRAAVEAIPETAAQIAKDVGGVVTKGGAGFVKGVTLGAVNPEQGTVGIPFTSKKWTVAPKLADALKDMGVSEEIADNAWTGTGAELAGSLAPWTRISKAVGAIGKAAKGAVSGSKLAPQAAVKTEEFIRLALGTPMRQKVAQASARVAQEGATGAIFGAAQVREPGESMANKSAATAAMGAGLGAAGEAIGVGSQFLKLKEAQRFYKNLRAIFYEAKATDAAAADDLARDVLTKVVRKGGIDNIPRSELKESADALEEVLHTVKKNPKAGPAGRPATETTVEPKVPEIAAPGTAPAPTPVSVPPPNIPPAVAEAIATPAPAELPPAEAPAPAEPDIVDALAEIRKVEPPPVAETPPTPSEVKIPEAPPPQKEAGVPSMLPTMKPGATEGTPHALFAYNQSLGKGFPVQAYYNVFGDKKQILEMTKGAHGFGSSVTIETLKKHGIPVIGREPRAEGMIPGQMNAPAEKAFEQPKFEAKGSTSEGTKVPGPERQAIEQAPAVPPESGSVSGELQSTVFPAPQHPSFESISRHPDFIKVTDNALSVVNRYAKERGITPGKDYAKDLWKELHDQLGRVRMAPAAERVKIATEVMAKYPNLEEDFVALKDKLWSDATEGYFEKFIAQTPVEPAKESSFSGGGYALAPMPSDPAPAAPEPKKGPGQPEFPETMPKTEPGPPEATHETPIFELPEMVELAKELMQGKFPQVVKKIRAAGGRALGVFYPGRGIIQIRADQFKNPEDAAHTLSHEVGHLADWLPEGNIKRGNIIGRIASLQKYLKDKFIGESFEKHLFNNKKFKNELIALTDRWHPFDKEKAPKEYLSYRYSAPELYAEAWSVLLNNPKFLKDTAPAFYKAFFDYLDKKPDVKALFEDLGDTIKQGKTAETRHARETAAYAKGDLAAKLKNEARENPLRTIWDEMRESLVDTNSKMISSVAKARKAGKDIPAEVNPLHALEELRYSSAELSDYAREQGEIYHRLKDAGIEWNDLGAYLKADRVINERAELANPGGQTPKAAKEEIDFLEKKYGDKFKDLKAAADEMRGPRREYLIKELEKAEMLSPELLKKIKENKAYSPFDIIIEESEKSLGGASSNVGPQIYSQIGTLRDIKNPATALVMKDLALLRSIRVQQAKLKQADWMLEHEPTWIKEAETKWNGAAHVPMEPADRENTGLMAFYQNGKIRAYYVPRTIADTFKYDPTEASLMMDAWERMNSFFKQIFTAANPGFQVMNIPRDMNALVMNIRGMNYPTAIKYYLKTAGSAKRFAKGEHDPLIQEMLRRKVLITPQNRWSTVAHDVEMESIINRFSDKENEYERWYSKIFGPMLDRVKMLGQIGESISKISGFQYLKDHQAEFGLTDQDINHLVRSQAGSPPFLISGKQSRVIGRLLLFFNPAVQGWRRSFEAARLNPGEYAAKTMKYVFLPKLLQYLAWAGIFGEGTRRLSRKFSSYNHANYIVIPLGEGDKGKGIGLKLPMDETSRFFGGLMWYALTSQPVAKTMEMLGYPVPKGDAAQDLTKLFSYTAGQTPNLTPILGAVSNLVQYASGKIPYDDFRGKPAIPQNVFDAGGKRSHVAFLKYQLNQLGTGIVYRFGSSELQKVKSDLEKVLGAPVIGNVLSRFIMSSNFGESELIANSVARARKEDARQKLDYRETVVENIMAHDKPAGPEEIATLYAEMMKDGLLGDALHIKKFSEFQSFYQRLQSQRLDDPYANGLLFAKSDAEKGAVLDVAKENLSEEEYNKLVGYSISQKFISAKTLVADEFRKSKKK